MSLGNQISQLRPDGTELQDYLRRDHTAPYKFLSDAEILLSEIRSSPCLFLKSFIESLRFEFLKITNADCHLNSGLSSTDIND